MDAFTPVIKKVAGIVSDALSGCDPRPHVSVGGSGTLPAYAAVVFETPESVQFSDPSTSVMCGGAARGPYAIEFTVGAQMWASRKSAAQAGATVNEWATLVMAALARDKTLGGLAIHAEPAYMRGGSVAKDRVFTAAVDFGIRVKLHFDPCGN